MEKTNDTMTICTLEKNPTAIPIRIDEYKFLTRLQQQYDMFVCGFMHAITLDLDGDPTIDYDGRKFLLQIGAMMEPEAFNQRMTELRERKGGE